MQKTTFVQLTAAFFILLFTYTAVSKLMEPITFHAAVERMHLLKPFASVITYLVPITEIIIAALLQHPRFMQKGLFVSAFLMMAFTVFIAVMLATQSSLPCSCGGIISSMGWGAHLAFDAATTILAFVAYGKSRSSKHPSTFYSNKTGVAENLQQSKQFS